MRELKSWDEGGSQVRSLLVRCREAIRSAVPDADIILFGSRARGDAQPDSDMDLMILVDEAQRASLEGRILDVIYPVELESGVMISFLVESREHWNSSLYRAMPLIQAVEREGVRA